eukprot:CAMPEP_0198235158 /NCGR_PEP_ID=MMETSP1446-20131203/1069_1 /TAXON_ID=1461542 ORGANISM="Unidentified sp, Strain CCMP2111" /NCGR_SAMPLE_ID=MMETSP1446 /ASSEMBLY_ACC=CAM_ASM_001112 /LENGTH=967 /DNA_ID=CAMNT_0043916203 /DNA_START=101 /DNA_END=3001 /DNA_ORIENTATION=+
MDLRWEGSATSEEEENEDASLYDDLYDEEDEEDEDEYSGLQKNGEVKVTQWSEEVEDEVAEISLRIESSLALAEESCSNDHSGAIDHSASHVVGIGSMASQDLLGLGSIDVRELRLIRNDEKDKEDEVIRHPLMRIKSKTRPAMKNRPSFANIGSTEAGRFLQSQASPAANVSSATLNMVLPSSEDFDPLQYLAKVHKDSSVSDLQRGLEFLQRQLLEGNTQRMSLVKENFERFINCKNTIDDVHLKLRQNELGDTTSSSSSGVESASTVLLVHSLKSVHSQATKVFQPLIDQQKKTERIRSFLVFFRRHQWFFETPQLLEELLESGKHEQVTSCYKKAQKFIEDEGKNGTGKKIELFRKVFREIEMVVNCYKTKLYVHLNACASNSDSTRAEDIIKMLVHLQGNHILAQSLTERNPLLIYLESITEYTTGKFNKHAGDYEKKWWLPYIDKNKGQKDQMQALSLSGAILNIALSCRSLSADDAKLLLRYEMPTIEDTGLKQKVSLGKAQTTFASRLHSTVQVAFSTFSKLFFEESSLLNRLKMSFELSQWRDIREEARAKMRLIMEAFKEHVQEIFNNLEDTNGLWIYHKQVLAITHSVLSDMKEGHFSMQDCDRFEIFHNLMVSRAVKSICRQLQEACVYAVMHTNEEVRALARLKPNLDRHLGASTAVSYIRDVLYVGFQQILVVLEPLRKEEEEECPEYSQLSHIVSNALGRCFAVCGKEYRKLGEQLSRKDKSTDYKSQIREVLQALKDLDLLQNAIYQELSGMLSCLLSDDENGMVNPTEQPLSDILTTFKSLYVGMNSSAIQQLKQTYIAGTMAGAIPAKIDGPCSTRSSHPSIRNHVLVTLHFFVEQHSQVGKMVPFLFEKILSLLVEAFVGEIEQGFPSHLTRKIPKDACIQSLLELSYLEKALGSYVTERATSGIDVARRHLYSKCDPELPFFINLDSEVDAALSATRLHWSCFHDAH